MKNIFKSGNFIIKSSFFKKEKVLTKTDNLLLEESTFEKLEEALVILKEEEDNTRSKRLTELRGVFFQLPENL